MLVIGLTGSIGMGKSAAAQHFRNLGVPVCDADAEVHRLYEGEAVPAIAAAFPGAVRDGKVDRALLAQEVAGAPEKLKLLESIVHPMVVKAELDFLREQERQGAKFAVLEIPLLFETDAHHPRRCHRGGERAGRGAESARARAARHEPGETRGAAQAATVRRRKALPRRLRCGHGDDACRHAGSDR